MRFNLHTTTLSQWLADNPTEDTIEFIGDIDIETIDCYSDLIMESEIKFVDISNCNVVFSPDDSYQTLDDYVSCYNEEKLSPLLKLFYNVDYCKSFIIKNQIIITADAKVLVHISDAKEISVPDGIEVIGKCAFAYYEVSKLHLPNSLKEIGLFAISDCDNLEYLDIPNSVTKIKEGSFSGTYLSGVNLPDNIEVISEHSISSLEIFNLPKHLKRLESDNNFMHLSNSVELPLELEYVGSNTLCDFTEIHFPASVKYIADDFWYESGVCCEEKPRITVDPDNKYFYVDKDNNLCHKFVEDVEEQKRLSEYALSFIPDDKKREKYEGVILTPIEMLQLVNQMPETYDLRRNWFYWDLAQCSFLTDEERKFVKYLLRQKRNVLNQLRSWDEKSKFLMFGVYDDNTELFITECDDSYSITKQFIKEQCLFDKYLKIIVRKYNKNDKVLKNPLGQFEITEGNVAINFVSFTLPPPPEEFQKFFQEVTLW